MLSGLSVWVEDPLWFTTTRGVVDSNVHRKMSAYSHELQANGGYHSCNLTLFLSEGETASWLSSGLGRHVTVFSPVNEIVFEGFVNQVRASNGSQSSSSGPFIDIRNRVKVAYTTTRYNTNPPVGGHPAETEYANNTVSQDKYGIQETILSGGERSLVEAEQDRDTSLADTSFPVMDQAFSLRPGASDSIEVQVECLGYIALLDNYVYNQVASAGNIDASDKIAAVIAADPNGIFSTADTLIETNTLQVESYEDENQTALSVINKTVSFGDSSDNRYIFGVVAGREAYYRGVGTSIADLVYKYAVNDNRQVVSFIGSGYIVNYWDIKPGVWLLVEEDAINTPLNATSNLREEPSAVFVESVNFTAPWGLEIRGSRIIKSVQRLAKAGVL